MRQIKRKHNRWVMKLHMKRRREEWGRVTKHYQPWRAERDIYNIYKRNYKLRPIWLLLTILQKWNKFYVKSEFRAFSETLDKYLVDLSSDRGSYMGGIEDVHMQCDPMNNLSADEVGIGTLKV